MMNQLQERWQAHQRLAEEYKDEEAQSEVIRRHGRPFIPYLIAA